MDQVMEKTKLFFFNCKRKTQYVKFLDIVANIFINKLRFYDFSWIDESSSFLSNDCLKEEILFRVSNILRNKLRFYDSSQTDESSTF